MKKINLLILCSILYLSYSCSGMLDNIQPYLDEGETIYVGKLDSLKAFSGKNRIKIKGKMMYGVNQIKCVINYRNPITLQAESQEFPIERQEPREEFEFILENLTEGQYDFSVITYDPKNNQSIPTEISAYAYGEQYQQSLINRIIRNISPEQILDEKNQTKWIAKIDWNISRGDGIIGCNIEYEQENGNLKSIYIPVEEITTELDNFKAGGKLRYNTEYMPEETSLDKFITEYKEFTLPSKSYIGVTKDLTHLYIKNAGHPITGHDVANNWGYPDDWKWNEVMTISNGAGGAGFATYSGGIIQFESTKWDQGKYENGKIWQTFTLPEGKYEIRVEVGNAAYIEVEPDKHHMFRFAVVKGKELPDNNELPDSESTLSYFKFERANETVALPAFELTEPTKITIGWVVSVREICRNIEFKSVRLWSIAE